MAQSAVDTELETLMRARYPVNAYGIYSDAASDELMKALQTKIAS